MNRTTRLILIPIILVLLVVAWFFGMYMPLQHQAGRLKGQIQKMEAKAKEIVPQAKVDILKTNVDTLMNTLSHRNNRLYPEDALLQIGKVFGELGKQSELNLVKITPDYKILTEMATAVDDYVVLPVLCEYEGSFNDLTRFIDSVPEFPFDYEIRFFLIHHHEEDKTKIVISLQGEILVQKSKAQAESKDKAAA